MKAVCILLRSCAPAEQLTLRLTEMLKSGLHQMCFPCTVQKQIVYEIYYWLEDHILVISWCSIIFSLTHMHDQTIKSVSIVVWGQDKNKEPPMMECVIMMDHPTSQGGSIINP